jgi:hypothetical protein
MSDFSKVTMSVIAGVSIVVSVYIGSAVYGTYQRNHMMARDIQSALDRGFNPLVIRCAYADESDRICMIYATAKQPATQVEVIKPSISPGKTK